LPARLLLRLIDAYQRGVSPGLGARCRYQPTCSAYAREAIERYGAFKGALLTLRRLARCTPVGGRGWDPVP
jgi:hypothetical protein